MASVAKRANVSPSTVSRVLSGRPGIALATCNRVRAAAAEVGYQPDLRLQRFFRTIRSGSKIIAFITTSDIRQQASAQDGFYSRVLGAIQKEARTAGLHLLLADPEDDVLPNGNFYCVAEGLAGGVIAETNDQQLLQGLAGHVPVVSVNHECRVPGVSVVIPDIERAAKSQMEHLWNMGHRRIACFRIRPGIRLQDVRFWTVYESLCDLRGITPPPEYMVPIQFGLDEHPAAIAAYLDRVLSCSRPPTAILSYDRYAVEIIRQLRRRNLRVPEDLSVIGFDDHPFGRGSPIPLTTYRQNFETMARVAVQLLTARMKDPTNPVQTVEVEGTFIVRESTAPPLHLRQGALKEHASASGESATMAAEQRHTADQVEASS